MEKEQRVVELSRFPQSWSRDSLNPTTKQKKTKGLVLFVLIKEKKKDTKKLFCTPHSGHTFL